MGGDAGAVRTASWAGCALERRPAIRRVGSGCDLVVQSIRTRARAMRCVGAASVARRGGCCRDWVVLELLVDCQGCMGAEMELYMAPGC